VEFTGKEENGVKIDKPEKARDMACYKISLDKIGLPSTIKIDEFGEYVSIK
jgi:hypothetical protein